MVQDELKGEAPSIRVEINGHPFMFVFDTGADDVCITLNEVNQLVNWGELSPEDVQEVVAMQDATGRVSNAVRVILRTVKVGNRALHDVEALVIPSTTAKPLFGQSALKQFGRYTVDNEKGEIILE